MLWHKKISDSRRGGFRSGPTGPKLYGVEGNPPLTVRACPSDGEARFLNVDTVMTYTYKISKRLAVSRTLLRFVLLGTIGATAACGSSSPTGPDQGQPQPATPGWLTVQMTSPNNDDGAVQLRVTGPAVDSIVPDGSFDGFGAVTNGSAEVVVTGAVGSGNVARFRVADVNRSAAYSVEVVAAAQLDTWAVRPNTASYHTVIVR